MCISADIYIYGTFYSLICYQVRELLGMNFGTSIHIVISVIIIVIIIMSNLYSYCYQCYFIIIIIIMSNFYIRNTSLHLSKSEKCLKYNVRDNYSASQKLCILIVLQKPTYNFIHCFCFMNALFCYH